MPFDPFSSFALISCEPVILIKPAGASSRGKKGFINSAKFAKRTWMGPDKGNGRYSILVSKIGITAGAIMHFIHD